MVLKDERRDAYEDAAGLWARQPPQPGSDDSRSRRWWDFTDLLSWLDAKGNIRVVRSEESWTVKPQLILLLAFLAYNIFQAFFALNLNREVRRGRTVEFWVRLIAAEISRPAFLPNGRATLTYASVRHTRMLLKGFV